MKQLWPVFFLCIVLGMSTLLPAWASYGRVVYAQTPDKTPDGPADIWEKDLHSGSTRVLIPHASFPKGFDTPVRDLAISPNGEYLALVQETRIETPTDSGYDPEVEEKLEVSAGGLWIWERKAKSFKKVIDEPDESFILQWSPSGARLLIFDWVESFWVYEAGSGKLSKFGPFQDLSAPTWSAKEDGILLVVSPEGKESVVYCQPLNGEKQRVAFRWPQGVVQSIAQSPDGSSYALMDARGVFLFDEKAETAKKLSIPVEEEGFGADFSYDREGKRLAILTSHSFGEPHINLHQELWYVTPEKAKAAKLGSWSETYLDIIGPDEGSVTNRTLAGWSPDGESILLIGRITWGGEGVADNRDDWFDLTAHNVVYPKERVLFDSGGGCQCLAWWPGPD